MNIELLRLEVLEQIRNYKKKYCLYHNYINLPSIEYILQNLHDDINKKFDKEKNNTFINKFKKIILKKLF